MTGITGIGGYLPAQAPRAAASATPGTRPPDTGPTTPGTVGAPSSVASAAPAAALPQAPNDAAKRALIGSVFRIDATTDLAAMFGDIQFAAQDLAQASAFMRGLESIRAAPPRDAAATALDRKV